jgi:PAS domain S-box-containing protein
LITKGQATLAARSAIDLQTAGHGAQADLSLAADAQARVRASLLESVGDAVIATTPDGTLTYLNSTGEQLFGWRSEELLGREAITTLAAPQSVEDAERILSSLLEGKRYVGRQKGTRRDGTTFAAQVTAWSVRDERNEIIGLAAIIGDQTERTQVERSSRKRKLQSETLALLGVQALRQRMAPEFSPDMLVSEAVDVTRRLLGADHAVVLDLAAGEHELRQRAASPRMPEAVVVPGGSRSFAGYITLARKAIVVDDTRYDGRFEDCRMPDGTEAASAVGAPIFGVGGIVGVLAACSATTDKFDEEDTHFVQGMANIVGTALL